MTPPPHNPGVAPQRHGGVIALEYTIILLVFAAFMAIIVEFYRLSLVDQTLARATHEAAIAAGRDPARCEEAAQSAFTDDRVAAWLLDRDDSGTIGFVMGAGTAPNGSASEEIRVEITADDGRLANGVEFTTANCGSAGSWIRVRSTLPVRPRFATGMIHRQHESWAVNQR